MTIQDEAKRVALRKQNDRNIVYKFCLPVFSLLVVVFLIKHFL
jgi:hypothetical protein